MQDQFQLQLIRQYDPNKRSPVQLVVKDRGRYYITKRILDFVIASLLLVLLSPLMMLIAVAILLYSPGPAFFAQERVGAKRQRCGKYWCWNRVNFRCYKFRTMRVDVDASIHQAYVRALITDDQQAMTALQGQNTEIRKLIRDPRVTRLGKFLRKSSLDELPQLWNVLRGEMSLVGPRPAIPYEVEMYKPWYLQRLEAQPGITGLQQVTARSLTGFDHQVRLDIQYIETQSLWLDIRIMLKTPFVILTARGAE